MEILEDTTMLDDVVCSREQTLLADERRKESEVSKSYKFLHDPDYQ